MGKSNFLWLWGWYPVVAALKNPERKCHHLLLTEKVFLQIESFLKGISLKIVAKKELDTFLPGAVHQGVAIHVSPLPKFSIQELCASLRCDSLFLVLDHLTDPHNVGALIRTAAALEANGVIFTQHHSPPLNGVLAKSASGALEKIRLFEVTNLAQLLKFFKKKNIWCVGLAEDGPLFLSELNLTGPIALVMGAEDRGLRRLTRDNCDIIARLPTSLDFPTLNVSAAGSIALYEMRRSRLTSSLPLPSLSQRH